MIRRLNFLHYVEIWNQKFQGYFNRYKSSRHI